ncbi:hypothetical protein D3C73_577320 [compost metagenome]
MVEARQHNALTHAILPHSGDHFLLHAGVEICAVFQLDIQDGVTALQQIEQFFQDRNPFSGKFSAKPRSGIRLQYLAQCHILYQSAAIRCAVQALVVNEDQPSVKGHLHIGFNAGCPQLKTLAECRHRILRAGRRCAAVRKINRVVHLIQFLRLISVSVHLPQQVRAFLFHIPHHSRKPCPPEAKGR